MIKALIFDFSGTLIDDIDRTYEATVRTTEEFGLPVPERENYGRGGLPVDWKNHWDKVFGCEEKAAKFNQRWKEVHESITGKEKPFDGVAEFLDRMNSKYLLALATNAHGTHIYSSLKEFGIDNSVFGSIITADSAQKLKPDPQMLYLCCEELGVPPNEAVFIGDTVEDMVAGRAAGTKVIGVAWGNHGSDLLENVDMDFYAHSWQGIEKWLEAQK